MKDSVDLKFEVYVYNKYRDKRNKTNEVDNKTYSKVDNLKFKI